MSVHQLIVGSLGCLRSFRRDRRGGIAVITAFSTIALVGSSAIAIDVMTFYRTKRTLQTATDLAAIAAAADPAHANAAANLTLASNQVSATITGISQGSYTLDPTIPAKSRFKPAGQPATAFSIDTLATSRLYLGGVFRLLGSDMSRWKGGVPIAAHAVAMRKAVASFGIGSRLASLDSGGLNGLLTATTGSNVNLTLLDYRSLAATQINLFSFSKSLSTAASLTADNYSSVLAASVSPGSAIGSIITQAGGSITQPALDTLRQIASGMPSGNLVSLGNIVAFGPYSPGPIATVPSITTSMNALDLLVGIVGLATNGKQVDATIQTGLPLLSARLSLAIGSPAHVVINALPGDGAATEQVRLQITFGVTVPGLGVAQLPITVSVARATAVLGSVSCPIGQRSASVAVLNVTPSVGTAGIGTMAALDDFSSAFTLKPAPILSLVGVATVTGAAQVAVGGSRTTPVSFNMSDVANGTIKTVSSSDMISTLASSLLQNLQLSVALAGLNLGTAPGITVPLKAALTASAPAMDVILASTLRALGIGLGQADTWVSDIQCGSAVLMN